MAETDQVKRALDILEHCEEDLITARQTEQRATSERIAAERRLEQAQAHYLVVSGRENV